MANISMINEEVSLLSEFGYSTKKLLDKVHRIQRGAPKGNAEHCETPEYLFYNICDRLLFNAKHTVAKLKSKPLVSACTVFIIELERDDKYWQSKVVNRGKKGTELNYSANTIKFGELQCALGFIEGIISMMSFLHPNEIKAKEESKVPDDKSVLSVLAVPKAASKPAIHQLGSLNPKAKSFSIPTEAKVEQKNEKAVTTESKSLPDTVIETSKWNETKVVTTEIIQADGSKKIITETFSTEGTTTKKITTKKD